MSYASEVLADSPLVYWRLGESSGTVAADASGNGRTGTYAGTYTQGVSGLISNDTDTAVSWTGVSGSRVEIASATWMNVGTAMTVEAWIKSTDQADYRTFWARSGPASPGVRSWAFRTEQTTGRLQFVKIGGGTVLCTGTTDVTDDVAHHVVATYDGANIRLYVDGVLQKTTPATGSIDDGGILKVANNNDDFRFIGTIDEVALYNTVLSDTRIQEHYQAAAATTADVDAAVVGWVANDVTIPVVTDTSNKVEGFQLGGWVTNEAPEPAIATPPAVYTHTRSDDMALYLPPPVIVDGRIVR